jgi:hypothetical protein
MQSHLISQILLTFTDNFKEHREDLSAVLLSQNNDLWLGSDETSTLERLSLVENKFIEHQQIQVADFISLPAPESQEIDVEGLAYSDYYLWLVGSHSYKRKKPKSDKSDTKSIERLATVTTEANRYILGRIPLVDGQLFTTCPHPQNADKLLTAAKLELTAQGNILLDIGRDCLHRTGGNTLFADNTTRSRKVQLISFWV